jgi:hypothetical protein
MLLGRVGKCSLPTDHFYQADYHEHIHALSVVFSFDLVFRESFVFDSSHIQYNTIQYNKLYLKSENIKHYNTSSNELLNPTYTSDSIFRMVVSLTGEITSIFYLEISSGIRCYIKRTIFNAALFTIYIELLNMEIR